jgi:hypothetical protein
MTDNIIDLEAHFIDEQVYNQRLQKSDDEISDALKKELSSHVRKAMQMFGHKLKGYHIQIYGDVLKRDGEIAQIYIAQNLTYRREADPIVEAEIFINE